MSPNFLRDDSLALLACVGLGGHGPRVAIKDCLDISGYPTRCGSRAFAEVPPAKSHAEVVSRLLDHGCRIVGKANMHELAYGVTGVNDWTGTPVNVRFSDRIPGGSSSGSAVSVAAGLVDFAIGTDTGGSIRLPAACCGIFGFKPSFGKVSRVGGFPARSSLDCIGPLAADMEQIIAAMAMISSDFEPVVCTSRPRLGRPLIEAERDVSDAIDTVLERVDADVEHIELPSLDEAFRAGLVIMGHEMAGEFAHLCGTGLLGRDVDARLQAATTITSKQVAEAEAVRARFRAEVDAALTSVDAIVTPTLPCVPPRIDEPIDAESMLRLTRLVRPFNLSGHPALSIPTLTASGLPAALQLIGRHGDDAALCAIGQVVAEAL